MVQSLDEFGSGSYSTQLVSLLSAVNHLQMRESSDLGATSAGFQP